MGKTDNNKPKFAFAKLASANNYKKWACEMKYSVKSAKLWKHTLLSIENLKFFAIKLKGENFFSHVKLEQQKNKPTKSKLETKAISSAKNTLATYALITFNKHFRLLSLIKRHTIFESD